MVLRTKARQSIFVQDVNGAIKYTRTILAPAYVKDRDIFYELNGSKTIAPLDHYLGIDKLPFGMSYSMMARCAVEAVKSKSYVEAAKTFKEAGYKKIGASNVDKVCEVVGQTIWDYNKERVAPIAARLASGKKIGPQNVDIHQMDALDPDRVLILMLDGHTIYTLKYSTGNYGNDDGGKCGMDCRVGIAFKLSECSIVYDAAGGQTFRIKKKDYSALIGPKDEIRNYFGELALRNGADDCDLIVVISDGADWIHNMVEEIFYCSVHIRDLWHTKDCVVKFCKEQFSSDPEYGIEFAEHLCSLLDEGKISEFLQEMAPYKNNSFNVGGNKLVNPYVYVNKRKDGMEYALYRSLGLPVGSGAIESTNKVFHRRMRTTGSLWTKTKANRMVMIIAAYEAGGEKKILEILHIMKDRLLDIASNISEGEIHRTYKKKDK